MLSIHLKRLSRKQGTYFLLCQEGTVFFKSLCTVFTDRSSRSQMFFKIYVLENFAMFKGKHLSVTAYNFIQKRLQHSCFSVNITKIFKNSFLYRTFPVLLLNSFFANYQFLYPLEKVKKSLGFWKFKGVYKWNTGVKCFNVLNEVYIEKRTNEADQNIRLISVSYETLVDLGFHLFETSVNITYGLCSKSTSNIETFLLNVPFWSPDVFKGIRREHWKEMG